MMATDHAYKRAKKKRFGWNKKALNRMMTKAFWYGIKHSDNEERNIRIYDETKYIFKHQELVTLYRIKNKRLNYEVF
jgi:hypothetical protein